MVAEEHFRSDLYYRLAVVTITIPPLRDRPADLMKLAEDFLREFSFEAGRPNLRWPVNAARTLTAQRWPGNIRELRNAIQRAVLLTPPDSEEITLEGLGPINTDSARSLDDLFETARMCSLSFEDLEREYMRHLLAQPDAKIATICQTLGIDPATFYRKRKRYGL